VDPKDEIALVKEIDKALDRDDEFILYYQPIVELTTGYVGGHEALMRWHHPYKGILNPVDFISVVEKYERLEFKMCIRSLDLVARQKRFLPGKFIGINVSPVTASTKEFIRLLHDINVANAALEDGDSKKSGDDNKVIFELTESVYVSLPDRQLFLRTIDTLDIGLCFDDFGTGNNNLVEVLSSIMEIRENRKIKIKFDKFFCKNIQDPLVADLLDVLIKAFHHNNIKVVAEGIETEEHFNILRDRGCDYGQGYFFSKPLPLDQVLEIEHSNGHIKCFLPGLEESFQDLTSR